MAQNRNDSKIGTNVRREFRKSKKAVIRFEFLAFKLSPPSVLSLTFFHMFLDL